MKKSREELIKAAQECSGALMQCYKNHRGDKSKKKKKSKLSRVIARVKKDECGD